MGNPLKKLASQTAIYGVSSIVGRALNYLLVPYYTKVFLTGEYGVINELYAYVAFFNILFTFGLETAYFRFSNKNDYSESDIFNSSLTLVAIIAFVGSTLLIAFSSQLAVLVEYPDRTNFIIWLALILLIDALVAIPFARLRHENKAVAYAGCRLLNIGVNIGLNLFFITLCKGIYEGKFLTSYEFLGNLYDPEIGVGYVFISNLVANAMYLPLMYKSFLRWRFKLIKEQVNTLVNYSFPLMLMGLAGIANEVIDRPMLKRFWPDGMENITGGQAVGIYGASYKIATLMTLGIQAMRYAVEPFVFSQAKEKGSRDMYAQIMHWFVLIACFIFLFLSLNISWIGDLLLRSDAYKVGLKIVPIVLIANLFLGVYINLSIWFKLSEKTKWGTYLTLFGAMITIVGNYFLIPIIGYMGSAWTTLVCYFFMCVASYLLGQKHFAIPYKLVRNLGYIFISTTIYLLVSQLSLSNVVLNYALNFFIPFLVVGLIFWLDRRSFVN